MSAQHGLELIDAQLAQWADLPITPEEAAVSQALVAVREALTREPDWSAIVEGNLRSRLAAAEARGDAAVAEAAEEQTTHESLEADLRRRLESARRVAVTLEQECSALMRAGVQLADGVDEFGDDALHLVQLPLDGGLPVLINGVSLVKDSVESLGDSHGGSVSELGR